MTKLSWRQIACSCILAAIPSSVFAVDGVVLIDQTHALAGSITTNDTPGFPVTISQPGSYRLASNLIVSDANTSAIVVTANWVTIDLNGFSILGPGGCTANPTSCPAPATGIGVQAGSDQNPGQGPKGVRVMNGTVRGMGSHGILIQGDDGSVERVIADANAGTGIVVNGYVIASVANANGQNGIVGTNVRDSIATANGKTGIQASGVVSGSFASSNLGDGFHIQNGTGTANTSVQNIKIGVSLVCPSTLVGNTIVGNGQGSVIQDTNDNCVQANNAARP